MAIYVCINCGASFKTYHKKTKTCSIACRTAVQIQQYPGVKITHGRYEGAITIMFNTKAAALFGKEVVLIEDDSNLYIKKPGIDDNVVSNMSEAKTVTISVEKPESYIGAYKLDIDPEDDNMYILIRK